MAHHSKNDLLHSFGALYDFSVLGVKKSVLLMCLTKIRYLF